MLPSLASFVSLLQVCWSECPKTSHDPTATTLIPEMEVEVATRNFDRRNGTTQATAECHVLQRKHSPHKALLPLLFDMESCWWFFHVHLCMPLFEDAT